MVHLLFFIPDGGDCFLRGFTSGFVFLFGHTLYKEGFKCFEWLKIVSLCYTSFKWLLGNCQYIHTCLQNFRKIRCQTMKLWPFENGWVNFSDLKSKLKSEKEKYCGH